ncbi:hypothetical protein CWB96_18810 [Pseudoalteromonas citrea]|uniref:Cadherin domain-containing protein n=1 Tax=Pseudoalteromonas citrea TaxID=43655 RepID=A0A5S3XLS2_9GAMM|nr:hypothetical protein [Pseudoalteromonas citrea]TMP40349.1 hypothetical protein CWB97_18915 [Pseudoalteromonas citrea]TMP54699.1 hypothetical protein CWB96_18810 [Pseudoalteromonas citrea]
MNRELGYLRLAVLLYFTLQTFAQQSYASSVAPTSIFKLPGIGLIKEFIHSERLSATSNEVVIIDTVDGFDFISFLSESTDEYKLVKRVNLSGSVVSHTVLKHPETNNTLVAIITDTGQLVIIDAITKQSLFLGFISTDPLLSIAISGESKLFISSKSSFYEVNLLPSITVASHPDLKGYMTLGSFTKKDSTQLLFDSGDIYEDVGGKISLVSKVENGLFTDKQFVYTQDLNNDGLEEVITTKHDVKELDTVRYFEAIEIKSGSILVNYSGKRFISPKSAGDKAYTATWTQSKTGQERHYYQASYCITPLQLSPSVPLCREFTGENPSGYIHHMIVHYGDVNYDGTLDLIGRTEFDSNFVHMSVNEDQNSHTRLPAYDTRCKNSYINSVKKYEDTYIGLSCYGKYTIESAMSGGLRDIEREAVIDIVQGKTLVTQDFDSGRYVFSKQFDYTIDIDLDGTQETISFSNGPLYDSYILLVTRTDQDGNDTTLTSKTLPLDWNNFAEKFVYARDINTHDKHGLYIQLTNSTLYYEYGADFVELGDYVDSTSAAYKEETGVYALTQSGELKVINVSGSAPVITQFCSNDTAVGLEKSGLNKLIYSCKNRFGQFDTLKQTIDWEIEGVYNTSSVNSYVIDDRKLLVTSGSQPSVFEVTDKKVEIASIADMNLQVHVDKNITIDLPTLDDSSSYVWTSFSRLGELSTTLDKSNTFEYDPSYLGKEKLNYSIVKGDWEIARGTVNIDVYNKAPQLRDITLSTHWRNPIEFSLPVNDEDGENITYTFIDSPQVGELIWLDENVNTLRYTPTGYKSVESIQYRGSDGRVESAVNNIYITLTNTQPSAQSSSLAIQRNVPLTFKLSGHDPDGDPITYRLDTKEQIADLTLDSNTGEVTLVTDANSPQIITFQYSVFDSISMSPSESVSISVNEPTKLVPDSKSSGNIGPFYLLFFVLISCRRLSATTQRLIV